jgi:biopolymer transport protein ExbD
MASSADEEKAKLYKTIRVVIIIAVVLVFLFIAMMCTSIILPSVIDK